MAQRKSRKRFGRDVFPPAPSWPRPSFSMLIEAESALATLLWQVAADVRLWSAEPPETRAGLFAPLSVRARRQFAEAVREYPMLRWPLRTMEAMVTAPADTRSSDVALACSMIVDWAGAHHMEETATQYAEAAALASPRDAHLAAIAGTACARIADGARAEVWYRRATRLGRRTRDWEWYIRSYIRWGNLVYEIGDYDRARDYYEKAMRAATWRGRPAFAGQAAHGMLTVAIHTSTYADAEELGLKAFELYPANDARVPHLAHDVAYLLLRHAWYGQAMRILDAVLPMITRPHERIVVLGSVARAAAGLRDRSRFEQAAGEVELLAEICDEGAAMSCVHLAEGAAIFGDWTVAEQLAGRAIDISIRRGERDTQRQAYQTMNRITTRTPPAPTSSAGAERVEATAVIVLGRLQNLFQPAQRPGLPAAATNELPVLTTPV